LPLTLVNGGVILDQKVKFTKITGNKM